jgi:hypothetical protein
MNFFVSEVQNLLRTQQSLKTVENNGDLYIVAFVDILGFTSMINSDPKGDKYISIIKGALNAAMHMAEISKNILSPSMMDYRVFSDNICFWIPLKFGPISVASMFALLSEFQLNLLLNGLLCRGGVALGTFFVDNYFLYGNALLAAVKLEKNSKYPVISISEDIINDIKLIEPALMLHYFHKLTKKGPWFINYLQKVFYTEKTSSIRILNCHYDFILQMRHLHRGDKKILQKYQWAARYHDDIVGLISFKNECPVFGKSDV